MKWRIDLHVHSCFSGDTDADPEETIARAIELDLHGLAFTEHYFYGTSEPVEALKEKFGSRIRIFRGVEFSAAEGHCLIFGVNTDGLSLKGAPVGDLIRMVNAAGGVVIPSHPYRGGNSLGDLVLTVNGICAIEGYNGYNMHAMNERAVEAARRRGIPFTGGSDAHAPHEVGSCYTEFDDEITDGNLVQVLKRGNYRGFDVRKLSRRVVFDFLKEK